MIKSKAGRDRRPLDKPRWYAVHTRPNFEEKVSVKLQRQGFWIFYPHIRTKERRGRRKVLREITRPLLSRYVFVCLRFDDEGLFDVNETEGVSRVVCRRMSGEPLMIPGPVMQELIDRADGDGLLPSDKPKHWFKGKVGEKVELSPDAPYFGLIAELSSLAELDKKGSIGIWIKMLGSDREVSVPVTAVAKVAA